MRVPTRVERAGVVVLVFPRQDAAEGCVLVIVVLLEYKK